jgi:hypothetical protein
MKQAKARSHSTLADEAWARFAYCSGEEVIVSLGELRPWLLSEGRELPAACTPRWTIARVVSRVLLGGDAHYVLNFLHDGDTCICMAPEAAIDGTA